MSDFVYPYPNGSIPPGSASTVLPPAPGYGITPYGLGAYGSVGTSIFLAGAWAISTHGVRVITSSIPKALSAFAVGDALNPATWTVARLDSGDFFTVLGVSRVDQQTFDLALLEPLGNHFVTHQVGSTTLLAAAGFLITHPRAVDFMGVVESLDPTQAVELERLHDRDLKNPPIQLELGGFAGTLVIGSDGDYETEDGIPLLEKLIVRRLTTPKGAFRHLPNYGLGLAIKEPIPGGDLPRFKAEIERTVAEEPDVETVRCALLLDRSNTLLVQLRVRARNTGATFDVRLRSSDGRLVEV